MKNTLFFMLILGVWMNVQLDDGSNQDIPTRALSDEYVLESSDFFDPLTIDLKEYIDELDASLNKDSEDITINTSLNTDRTYTTGNMDNIDDFDNLLPDSSVVIRDTKKANIARKHTEYVDSVVNVFSLDPFSEDPHLFLGDHASYFKVVKKRSMIFYYVSRVILYVSIFYILVKFLNRRKDEQVTVDGLYDKNEHQTMVWVQGISIWLLFISAGAVFYLIGHPKSIIDNAGATLIYNFREINITAHDVSGMIENINAEKIKTTKDNFGFFSIANIIQNSLEDTEKDVETSKDFSSNMLKNPHLTSYSTPIALFFFAMVLTGLSSVAFVNKNSHFQMLLFLVSSLCLSYLIYNTGMYFANYSGLHDICWGITSLSEQEKIPESGLGIIHFVGCTSECTFFQQLVTNLKAQNAARKLFNNELFKIHRDIVVTAKDAVDLSNYLNRLDANNVSIKIFADLLQKNEQILEKLVTINKCQKIKEWLWKEEYGLCYEGSSRFLFIFFIYLGMILVYLVLMYSAIRSADVLEKLGVKKVVKKHTFDKLRYANNIKVE